jgi:hypothetical protein
MVRAWRWTVYISAVDKVAARETGGISKTDAVKGQILTQAEASRRLPRTSCTTAAST